MEREGRGDTKNEEIYFRISFQTQFKGLRTGSIDGGRAQPLKRSDSVRSATTVHMGAVSGGGGGAGLGGGQVDGMLLRKSKTELSINMTKKKNNSSQGNGAIAGQGRSATLGRETMSNPSSPGDLKEVTGAEQSNCVLM